MRSLRFMGPLFLGPLFLGLSCAVVPPAAHAQVAISVSVGFAPPALPIYTQPPMPAPGYLWTPGYWAWGSDGYYWVPGTWVLPPAPGLLWTPGYWAWENDAYVWIPGYWAPQVGFYGGIDYGYGYFGVGFVGGYWHDHRFYYNRDYNNFGHVHVDDVYSRRVAVHQSYVSYNGGRGGIAIRPTPQQQAFARQAHTAPTSLQLQHVQAASVNPAFRATANQGRPPVAATSEPGHLSGPGTVGARQAGAPYHPPVPGAAQHPAASGPAHPGYPAGGSPAGGVQPQTPVTTHPSAPPGHEFARPVPAPQTQAVHPAQPGPAPRPEVVRPTTPPHPEAARPPMPRAEPPHGPAAAPHPQPAAHPAEHQGERRDQQHP